MGAAGLAQAWRLPPRRLGGDHRQLPPASRRAGQPGRRRRREGLAVGQLQRAVRHRRRGAARLQRPHEPVGPVRRSTSGNLAHGDLGQSWSENAPVGSLILSYLPWTLGLLGVATDAQLRRRQRARHPDGLAPRLLDRLADAGGHLLPGDSVLLPGPRARPDLRPDRDDAASWFPSLFGYDIYTVTPGLRTCPTSSSVLAPRDPARGDRDPRLDRRASSCRCATR